MALRGVKQSAEHIARRVAAAKKTWKENGRKPGAGKAANTPEVLWSKVDKRGPNECWPWRGFKNAQGYGRTWIGDRGYYAHRVIFDLVNPGIISREAPKDMRGFGIVRHKCDNPPCCNPSHLIAGTQQDNTDDKVQRGRMPDYHGACSPRSKLTEEEVRMIRYQKQHGATLNALALLYGVSRATISGLLYGRHYQDVT